MAPAKPTPWLILILGTTSVVRGWAQWGKVPRSGWAYLSLGSGLVLLTLSALIVWGYRKNEP
jgi:hypothetical protein